MSLVDKILMNEPWAKPFEALFNPEYRYKLYDGGRGGGKSQHFIRAAVLKAMKKPTRILCCREVQNSIAESLHQMVKQVVLEYQEKYNFNHFVIQEQRIYNKFNGSEFLFRGLRDTSAASTQAVKSYEGFDLAIIDEAQTVTKRSLETFIPTIRKEGSEIWAGMNQLTGEEPILDMWPTLPKSIIVRVNYYDNPFLTPELLELALACKKFKPQDYKRIWLGIPSRDSIPYVCPSFSKSENVVKSGTYFNDRPLYLTCDFNVDPMMWAVVQHINDKSFYIDEIVKENTNTEECIVEFAKRYKDHKTPIFINGDASGASRSTQSSIKNSNNYKIMYNYLEKAGLKPILRVSRRNPLIAERITTLNDRIYHVGVKRSDKNQLVQVAERRLFVADRCSRIISVLSSLQYWPGTSEIKNPTKYEIKGEPELKFLSDHMLDAVSYHEHYYYNLKRTKKENKPSDEKSKLLRIKEEFRNFGRQRLA